MTVAWSLKRSEGPTIYDVARVAGVSAMTVSRVLNRGRCSQQSKDAVLRAVEALGYRPNRMAQAMARNREGRGAQSVDLTLVACDTPVREEDEEFALPRSLVRASAG